MDHQEGATHVSQHPVQREQLRLLECLGLVTRLRIEDVATLCERIELWPALREVVWSGERDESAKTLLLRRGAWSIDAAHADAHQTDATQIDAEIRRREMIEQRRD